MKLTTNRIDLFLSRYKILPPLFGFTLGILLNEYVVNSWYLIAAMGLAFGVVSLYSVNLRFLLLIPVGLLFATNPLLNEDGNIGKFIDTKVDIRVRSTDRPKPGRTGPGSSSIPKLWSGTER